MATTLKKYYSPLRNFCTEGISFTTLGKPENGSYLITSSREVQEKLEKSPLFRRTFKLVALEPAAGQRGTGATYRPEAEPRGTCAGGTGADGEVTRYDVATLQEARDIIMRLRAEKGMEAKNLSNTQCVLKAARELGVEFPKLNK